MIAEFGHAALWFAAALAALQLIAGSLALTQRGASFAGIVRPVAVVQGLLALTAFVALIALFMRTDLSVKLVAMNSHSAKPLIYKVAGTWGNHEGSMLLWVAVMGLAGGFVALVERRLREDTLLATLAGQAFVSLGFYVFLLLASNPFERLPTPVAEGQGLNPLLQDLGLAFHPPTLYLGYVGLSIAFSFAIGALVTGEVGPVMARAMRPWVLGAWVLLTLGITAGSYWAYYELGWGGWWFWDPVENASLMPWLAATALLHSISVLAARNALRAWTIMLAVIAFSMSMVGTFLVRSGILTSVHSFAVDPRRGTVILALLAFYVGGALLLFALRVGSVREGARFDPVSREGALVANNLLLSVTLGTVFVGTLYPLFVEAVTGDKLSVGPPYFNAVVGPLALMLAALMFIGPLLRWRRDDRPNLRRVALPAVVTVVALAASFVLARDMTTLARLGLAFAAGLAIASVLPLVGRKLRRTPLTVWGMVVAHLGVAVALAGMACDSAFTRETLVAARPGELATVGPWQVRLIAVNPVAGPNWTAVEASLEARRGSTLLALAPQSRTFSQPLTQTSEAAIRTRLDGQLYTVISAQGPDGRWPLRLWWKPMVTLIWLGGFLIALGGTLALVGRLWRDRRRTTVTSEVFA